MKSEAQRLRGVYGRRNSPDDAGLRLVSDAILSLAELPPSAAAHRRVG